MSPGGEYAGTILTLSGAGLATNLIGYKLGFYKLPETPRSSPYFRFSDVLGSFLIYFATFLPFSYLLFRMIPFFFPSCSQVTAFGIVRISAPLLCFFFFGSFCILETKQAFDFY